VNLSVSSSASGRAITVKCSGYGSPVDFKVSVESGNMIIDCAYKSFMQGGMEQFIAEYFDFVECDLDFGEGFVDVYSTDYLTYSDFGAVGDGVADDFNALYLTHFYANAKKYKVIVNEGTYNVGQYAKTIPIRTDVDWTGASFIIDDSDLAPVGSAYSTFIFTILSDYTAVTYSEGSAEVDNLNAIGESTTNIGFAPGYKALVNFWDENNYAYNRYGTNGNVGVLQRELVVVDANGNIIEDTNLLLDFSNITKMEVYRVDDEPITVTGGHFTTIANQAPPVYTSYARGILCRRANTTIKNTVHVIEGEGSTGAPYTGFFSARQTNNILFEGISPQSHKTYQDYYEDGSVRSNMGTYDLGGNTAANLYYKNCIQSNFFKNEETKTVYVNTERWGIMGSNYCKNMTYDGCRLSRLDAHAGIRNVTIKDTEISYIQLTGGGVANIENSTIYAPGASSSIVILRGDYGSTWRGDLILKDCTFLNNTSDVQIVSATWYNFDFGNYVCTLPNLIVDNLTVRIKPSVIYGFTKLKDDATGGTSLDQDMVTVNGVEEENINPYDIETTITIKNNNNGYTFAASLNTYAASKMTIIYSEEQ